MKKVLSAFAFVLFSIIYAQELGKEISVSQNWISVIGGEKLNLSNGRITNHTSKATKRLSLDFYLSLDPHNPSSKEINGILIAKNPVGSLKANTSISGISIQNSVQEMPKDGVYYQILALTETNGAVKDITVLSNQISIENGKLQIKKAENNVSIPDTNEVREINQTKALTDLSKPVYITVNADNSVSFEKDWKINIDYKNFMVNLTGGDIANNTMQNTNKLIVDVYLTKENKKGISSDFQGVHISKAPIDPIAKSKKLTGTSIKTNLRAIPPQGTYYIIMTLSELDSSGKAVVKSTKSFQNAITL